MTLDIHNWSSTAHQEIHKIIKDEIFPIVNQVDARLQNFEIQFLKEAAKFVRDFKSLAKEADESLAKHKALEFENERLLRVVSSQDIMSIVQSNYVVYTSNLQTELDPYNGMQQKFKRLQAQLGDLKGKSKDTSSESDTLDPLSHKLKNENVELEFQVLNYAKENAHLKTTYKNLFDSINVTRAQTKTITDTLQQKLHDMFYENAKLRAQLFDKVSEQMNITKGVDNTANTRRPQPRRNTKNDRVPSASKSSCIKNKEVEVEEHHRNLLLSKNKKHMSSECNNVRLAIQNNKSEVICAMCKQCLITSKHDVCMLNYVNGINSRVNNLYANVLKTANQNKHKPTVTKPKKVGSKERLASSKPRKPRTCLRWSPTGRMFDLKEKIIDSSESESQSNYSKDSGCSKHMTGNLKLLINFVWKFLGTIRFGNDHVAAILGLGQNLFSVGQFCDSDLEVTFRRNTCFVRTLKGVDLLKGNCTTNLYTINLHEMAYASPIYLMARATSTKSKDEAPKEIKIFLKKITVLLQALVIINDREDIGKLGEIGDIGFFIGYSANYCAYRVYNRRIKQIMETMNVTFDELLAMAFEQRSSKPGLQSMTSGQTSSRLDVTYVVSTITTQQPTEPAIRTASVSPAPQVLQTPMASTTTADTAPTPTNSSSQATNILNTSHDVDEL
ncbi:hypothetical protein Tco_0305122 [Tanacetum coccineum]